MHKWIVGIRVHVLICSPCKCNCELEIEYCQNANLCLRYASCCALHRLDQLMRNKSRWSDFMANLRSSEIRSDWNAAIDLVTSIALVTQPWPRTCHLSGAPQCRLDCIRRFCVSLEVLHRRLRMYMFFEHIPTLSWYKVCTAVPKKRSANLNLCYNQILYAGRILQSNMTWLSIVLTEAHIARIHLGTRRSTRAYVQGWPSVLATWTDSLTARSSFQLLHCIRASCAWVQALSG